MDRDNNNWLDALAGKNKTLTDEKDLTMVNKIGEHLRQHIQHIEPNEKGLSKLLQRLEDENLLGKDKKVYRSHNWQYGVAAALVLAISIPVVLLQTPSIDHGNQNTPAYIETNQTTVEDPVQYYSANKNYPAAGDLLDTQQIVVDDPEKIILETQIKLATMGYLSHIYQHNNNLVLEFTVDELTEEVKTRFSKVKINIVKNGIQHIEFIKSEQ